MNPLDLHARIAWLRCSRRRWPKTRELPFTAEQQRKHRQVLLYVWAGRGVRTTPAGKVKVGPGSCHWSVPGFGYHCVQDPQDPLGITAIHFDLLSPENQVVPMNLHKRQSPEILRVHDADLARSITEHIARVAFDLRAGSRQPPSRLASVEEIFNGFLRGLLTDSQASDHASEHDLWGEVTRHIHDHLHELPTLEQLAKQWGYSRSHFSREFHKHLGLSPQQYIINARTALVKELLRETDMSIGQTAILAGYPNVYALSRQFRRVTKTTPTRYRDSAR